nr:MAG TPA: hypothetical protein [Caudoviricetes sp.]
MPVGKRITGIHVIHSEPPAVGATGGSSCF